MWPIPYFALLSSIPLAAFSASSSAWTFSLINFQENYEPLDFVRNNEDVDLFTKHNWKIEIDYELVIRLMSECYRDMLTENYL